MLTVAIFLGLAVAVYGQSCPTGYEYNAELDACYKFYEEELCTRNADWQCIKDRGALCSIHSEEENKFVAEFIARHKAVKAPWIGLHRNPVNGQLYWADWTFVDYKDNGGANPFAGKRAVRCAYYAVDGVRQWVAASCKIARPFVCKISKNSRRVIKY